MFGAEARQLFCERFHVTVNFTRETAINAVFPAPPGLRRARTPSRAPASTTLFARGRFRPSASLPNIDGTASPDTREAVPHIAELSCRVPRDEHPGQHSVTFCDDFRNPRTRFVVKRAFHETVPRQIASSTLSADTVGRQLEYPASRPCSSEPSSLPCSCPRLSRSRHAPWRPHADSTPSSSPRRPLEMRHRSPG